MRSGPLRPGRGTVEGGCPYMSLGEFVRLRFLGTRCHATCGRAGRGCCFPVLATLLRPNLAGLILRPGRADRRDAARAGESFFPTILLLELAAFAYGYRCPLLCLLPK